MTHDTAPMSHRIPWCTLLLCAATLALSVHAAVEISGTWFGRVRIVQLEPYGLRWHHLQQGELWRLFTAQMVHVKQPHMLSSLACLAVLGAAVERRLGGLRLLGLWLVGGSVATLLSTLTVPAPWNLGTGASQAILAIAGGGLWRVLAGVDRSRWLVMSATFSIALAFMIDLVHVGYPKLGHVAGVGLGLLMGWLYGLSPRHRRAASPPAAPRA